MHPLMSCPLTYMYSNLLEEPSTYVLLKHACLTFIPTTPHVLEGEAR